MATQWLKRIRKTGQLTVFNKAPPWAGAFDSAIKTLNNLPIGVSFVVAKEEKKANVVIALANGATQYTYDGITTGTGAGFAPDKLHGKTRAMVDSSLNTIFFAVIFLPGQLKKATNKQKEVVIIHELLHACGMTGGDDEHDSQGIMFSHLRAEGDGLIELLPDKGAAAMPPIRIGSRTACVLRWLWTDGKACKTQK